MNKITVLAKNKLTYFIKRLTEEVGEGRLNLFDPWSDNWDFDPGELILCRTTGVYRSDKDLDYLKGTEAIRSINPPVALSTFRGKKTQYSFFKAQGLPHLPWLDLKGVTSSEIKRFIAEVPSRLYLMKPHYGQGGWGIRVLGPGELMEWFESAMDREFILQPYAEGAKELRYFFIEGGWDCALERSASGGPAANFRVGGDARYISTPQVLPEIIREVTLEIPIQYGAMDVLYINGEAKILEINTVPGIEQLESVTGHNVMKELVSSFEIR